MLALPAHRLLARIVAGRWGLSARVLARVGFRYVVVGCQAATVLITWPLWQVHDDPPMLPALPLPEVDVGVPLQLSLVLILVSPLLGVVVHTALVAYATLIDQTRLQPEIVSLVLLLWGSLSAASAQALGRAHLVSLWLFAGVNKLLSPTFMHETGQLLLSSVVRDAPAPLRDNAGYVIALAELGTGVLALAPQTRGVAAMLALAVHAGILLVLSPLGLDRNPSVWPWNVALAVSGFALIAPWREPLLESLLGCHRLVRPPIILLVIAPAGFYVAVTDAYLAHNLYSSNTPTTTWCDAAERCIRDAGTRATWRAFNVPLPPEHRLLEAYFARACRPGDRLIIEDPRWWAHWRGFDTRVLTCGATP